MATDRATDGTTDGAGRGTERSPASYQSGPGGHRGTPAVQRLVEYAPATGSLALWMRHRDADELPLAAREILSERAADDWLVGNDGRTIWYSPAFERHPLPEQTGLVAHQILHVALRHVPRERELRAVLGDVDAELFNRCADAIVNSALSHLEWLALPPASIGLDELLARVPAHRGPPPGTGGATPTASLDASLLRWDTESLYRAIDDRRPARGASRSGARRGATGDAESASTSTSTSGRSDADTGSEGAHGRSPGDGEHASGSDRGETREAAMRERADGAPDERREDGPIAAGVRALASGQPRDLFPGQEDPELEADETRRWSERLSRAHVSDGTQSLLRQLLADRPTPRTPWEQLLRTRLARSLAQRPELSWSRPNRSWLANRGRTAGGRRLPWQPGVSGTRAVPRLCLVIDVSGSIETRMLGRFASEMERLMRVHRAEIRLIVGDDRVREERLLRPGGRELRELVVEGGGGTDFAPLLEAAGRYRPDAVIVLTDLEGPAGEPPPWPVLWALLPGHHARAVPFGRLVTLD